MSDLFPSAEEDYYPNTTVTVPTGAKMACTDFINLVVDDGILEGEESFTICVGDSTSMVTIIDDDG